MERDLKDKVAVITGAAQGIGLEIAEKFLMNGAKVIILDVNEELGAEAVDNLTTKYGNKAEFIKCDVTNDLEAVSNKILDKYKFVDILVNNAGVAGMPSIRKTIEVNTIAVMEWTMKFFEHMRVDKGGKGGTVLNISSVYGFRIDPFEPYYKASKFAVMGFTKTIGHEDCYKKFGVRVVALCPGFTETTLTTNFEMKKTLMLEEMLEFMKTTAVFQKLDAVGRAAVEVFERADSGTAWLIEGDEPIVQC